MRRAQLSRDATGSAAARLGRLVRRFARSERGVSAVEFGFVGGPFLYLVFAILELAMMFWSGAVLETATANASRAIYTGQFQTSSTNATKTTAQLSAQFKTNLCSYVTAVFDCTSAVSIDIRNATDFNGATPPSPIVSGAYDTSSYSYQSIGPRQIGVITASMQYQPATKILASSTGLSNGNRLIMATATFMTEPY